MRGVCQPIGEGGAELPLVFGGGGDEAQEWREGEEVLTTLLLQMLLSEVTISQVVLSIPCIMQGGSIEASQYEFVFFGYLAVMQLKM